MDGCRFGRPDLVDVGPTKAAAIDESFLKLPLLLMEMEYRAKATR